MKKAVALSAVAFGLFSLSAAMAGDNETVSRKIDLAGFDQIAVAGVYEIDVKVGPDFSIELSGPQYEMDRVEVSVKNGALILGQRDRRKGEKNRNHRDGVDAVITMPSLAALKVSGVVDGHIDGVDAKEFKVNISGVGDIRIDGECGELDAQLSGVGDLDARGLECRIADVNVSGVGSATVFASDSVDARVSGMGDIDVYGSPKNVRKNDGMFTDITIH